MNIPIFICMRINGHCILLGELSTMSFGEPVLHADSHIFPLFILTYNMSIRTGCFALLVKNTTSILQGIAPCLLAACIKLICFLDNPRSICHVKVTFLILQRTVKYPNEQGLWTLHLVHEKKSNFDIQGECNTGHCYWEF